MLFRALKTSANAEQSSNYDIIACVSCWTSFGRVSTVNKTYDGSTVSDDGCFEIKILAGDDGVTLSHGSPKNNCVDNTFFLKKSEQIKNNDVPP